MENRLPKYHETFLPILSVLKDGGLLSSGELLKQVRDQFYRDLPVELLFQQTKNGNLLILNRIAWGKVYLKQAEMVQQPERGMVQITEKGRGVLNTGRLTLKQLLTDQDFLKNRSQNDQEQSSEDEVIAKTASPQDMIDSGFQSIEDQVKTDLLNRLRTIDPFYFEHVVLKLFQAMGYGDFVITKKSGDGGIDGIINQDHLGLEKIYIQSKRYGEGNKVREPLIRDFIGAINSETKKGIFVTTSTFDDSAIKKANDAHHLVLKLIDGRQLVDLMYKYNVGTQVKDTYNVKQIDEDFFDLE
jgi:restriction system protein